MRRVIVQYRVKPERVAEHEGLIRDVFAELQEHGPKGLRYGAFKHPDGVHFVHVALTEIEGNPFAGIAAFERFTAGIRDRCDEPPATETYAQVGSFGL